MHSRVTGNDFQFIFRISSEILTSWFTGVPGAANGVSSRFPGACNFLAL